MQRQPRRIIFLPTAMLCLLLLSPSFLRAQATAARVREAGLSSFVTYTRLSPDYDIAGNGITVGAGYTRFFKLFSPSVEARFKYAQARAVNESTFGGGVRIERAISYFHPYADFLVSTGTITFAQKSYTGSNGKGSNGSIVYSVGGGVDYDFANQWSARVDYQHESWNLGGTPALTLTPHAFSFGILYRIRLHRSPFQ